jgi:amino acid adenylation domain-containing protein
MTNLLSQLIGSSVRRFPGRLAAKFNESALTYQELDLKSTRLAHALRENGVDPGHRVGIYLDKSLESVIAVHGILKAGAVYVPLDPKAPALRLAYIVDDCGIRCLVSAPRKKSGVKQICKSSSGLERVILLRPEESEDEPWPVACVSYEDVMARSQSAPPEPYGTADDLAYILYTSGSTGRPKGVMISHRNAMTFVDWATEAFDVTEHDVLSNHAPLHFDLSIFDIFVAAKAGAAVVPVPDALAYFPGRLAEWIPEQRISVWYSGPSILGRLAAHGNPQRFSFGSLRSILFAGEVFPIKHLRQSLDAFPSAAFYNLYGPTETNVITYYQVQALSDDAKSIPIGAACAGYDVFALDNDGEPLTRPGIEGELYARGDCVAQGYWGDEKKTESVFTVESENGAGRVYKTGDIVSLDEKGLYNFIGRRDHMIKSRGYRIELGEIEARLYDHPDVEETAVIAIPDDEIGNRIKAYLCVRPNKEVDESEILRYCAQYLPRYMVPETIEFRDSLPRTATGKVDKKSLSG